MSTSRSRKPEPDFVVRLVGSGVKPWHVPLRVLGRILSAVQRLVDQRDDLADDIEPEEAPDLFETRTLQLLDITARSAGYAVSAENPEFTLGLLHETGEGIKTPDAVQWKPSAISSIDDLSQIARHLNCVIEFREHEKGKSHGDVIALIRPETAAEIKQRAFIHGFTSVYGRLERVGGATAMRCGIHVQERPRMLFCDVANSDLIRELGKHIYTDVVLSGEAVWYRANDQLRSLRVLSFNPAKTDSFADVARHISAIGGGWNAVPNPEAFLREMRG